MENQKIILLGGGVKKKMKTMTKLRRSTRGLSPIFATLILIAIAVIAGIVVYMFTSGFIANLTGTTATGQEKVAVQQASGSGTAIAVYAQYIAGGSDITINGAIIKDSNGTSYMSSTISNGVLATSGALVTVGVTSPITLAANHLYTVTLTSSKGGSFVSPAFTAP
jgi:archaeal type IV pilus assembly protein PilA